MALRHQIEQQVSDQEKGQKEKDLLPPSCFGNVILCQDNGCSEFKSNNNLNAGNNKGKVFIKNKYGNIYANFIEKPGKTVQQNGYQVFRNDVHYGDLGTNQIQFSLDTKRQLKKRLLEANNPKKVEPTFILEVGSKKTESNTF